jgi:hypothetical protein
VRKVLFDIADRNPVCLDEPKPVFIVQGFGDSAVQLQFSPWALRENYLELRNTIQREIKQAFDDQGIEIPFPQRVVRTAGPGDPFRGGGEAPLAATAGSTTECWMTGWSKKGSPMAGSPRMGSTPRTSVAEADGEREPGRRRPLR